jgi:hypothetical protein
MNKLCQFSFFAFLVTLMSCSKKDNDLKPYSLESNEFVITQNYWNLDKVSELNGKDPKILYDKSSSLFNGKNEFSNYKMKFSKDSSVRVFEIGNLQETDKWKFINHGSEIQIKKTIEGNAIILHINRIEENQLIFTQNQENRIIQYDFSHQ